MLNVDTAIILFEVSPIAVFHFPKHKLRISRTDLPLPFLIILLILSLTLFFFLARYGLKHSIGIAMRGIYPIAVNFVIALEGGG